MEPPDLKIAKNWIKELHSLFAQTDLNDRFFFYVNSFCEGNIRTAFHPRRPLRRNGELQSWSRVTSSEAHHTLQRKTFAADTRRSASRLWKHSDSGFLRSFWFMILRPRLESVSTDRMRELWEDSGKSSWSVKMLSSVLTTSNLNRMANIVLRRPKTIGLIDLCHELGIPVQTGEYVTAGVDATTSYERLYC